MMVTKITEYIRDPAQAAPLLDKRWATQVYRVTLHLSNIAGGLPATPA